MSIGYSLWSISVFHVQPQETLRLYAATAAGLVLISWAGVAGMFLVSALVSPLRRMAEESAVGLSEYLDETFPWMAYWGSIASKPASDPAELSLVSLEVFSIAASSFGGSVISVSLLEVSLSFTFWLVVGGSLLASFLIALVGLALLGMWLYKPSEEEVGSFLPR